MSGFSMSLFGKIRYLLKRSVIHCEKGAEFVIGNHVKIRNCRIVLYPGAKLIIGDNVKLFNATIIVDKGVVELESNVIVYSQKKTETVKIYVDNGCLYVGHHTKLALDKIWIRYGGNATIGIYTNINELSEIRCDEQINIGSYCQVSYNVRIWDTNTHNILPPDVRKDFAIKYYPAYGHEAHKPKTSPVFIGNYCWIGERAAILKGSKIGNNVVVGYNTTLTNSIVDDNKRVVTKIENQIYG